MSREPVLDIPSTSLWDEKIKIKLSGLTPGDRAEITALVHDEAGVTWRSRAVFQADESGEVDPAITAPSQGTYSVCDQMGLFWSMKAEGSSRSFQKKTVAPSVFDIEVKQNGSHILKKKLND